MLSLEVDEIDESASWAVWEALGAELSRCLPTRALTTMLHEFQHRLLARVCGPRWQPQRGVPAPFACPSETCGADSDFARKGRRSRLRRLDTAVGVLRVRLWQARCRACGRVFAPLLVMLGLQRVRRTDRLTLRLSELATQVSYGRAARIADELAGMPATAPRAHAALADVAGLLGDLPPAVADPEVVLLDGTGARAGGNRLGVGVHLAVGLVGRGGPLRRRRAETAWLAATVDEPWQAMADRLAGLAPPVLALTDGEQALTDLVAGLWPDTAIQRCWWHLPRGLVKAAYADPGHPHIAWARGIARRLGDLVGDAFNYDWDQPDALEQWDDLVKVVPARYTTMAAYLAAARPHAFTFLDDALQRRLAHLGGIDLGTGVIERVMRELNARTDIGGSRWSVPGLRDLTVVKTAQMLEHPIYQQLRKEILLPNTIGFDLNLKVNA
jgi:hypothetical protein